MIVLDNKLAPLSVDIQEIEHMIIEVPRPSSPNGAIGIDETALWIDAYERYKRIVS
jgi:hypothetical protein